MRVLLYVNRATCAGCAACVEVCPTGAIRLDEADSLATIDSALCNECLACLEICPAGAIRQVSASELVPSPGGEIVEGQVIESQVIPARGDRSPVVSRQPGRLVTLAGTTLSFLGSWLLPRAADALAGVVERRLTDRTNSESLNPSLRSGRSSLGSRMGGGGRGRGRRRRRRGRGR